MSEQTIKQNQEDELAVKQSTSSLLSSLRLPDTYSVSGGTALPLKASFGKLNKHRFCRIHPGDEYKFRCLVVDDKDRGGNLFSNPKYDGPPRQFGCLKNNSPCCR